MKSIVSRYPLNANGSDFDREVLYDMRFQAKYPNFVSFLALCCLPIPTIAEVARVSPDVLIDAALGLDTLTAAEDYAVRAALGLPGFEPINEEALYDTEENTGEYPPDDWSVTKADLMTASKPINKHPAYELIKPYLSRVSAPYRVAISALDWLDFVEMKYHRNTRNRPYRH